MKKLLLLAVLIGGIAFSSVGQTAKPQWVTIATPNLKCWECKKLLDDYLNKVNGVQFEKGLITWRFNLLKGEIKIQYWPDRANPNAIKTAIANGGFDADEIKATPESYKTLPPACKRAEEGGGPKKGKPCHMEPQR
jgi:periplasmic mercuric ion binding protein